MRSAACSAPTSSSAWIASTCMRRECAAGRAGSAAGWTMRVPDLLPCCTAPTPCRVPPPPSLQLLGGGAQTCQRQEAPGDSEQLAGCTWKACADLFGLPTCHAGCCCAAASPPLVPTPPPPPRVIAAVSQQLEWHRVEAHLPACTGAAVHPPASAVPPTRRCHHTIQYTLPSPHACNLQCLKRPWRLPF